MPLLAQMSARQLPAAALRLFVFLVLTLIPGIAPRAAEPKTKLTREYDLKAAFLFNFAQFVEWPPESFTDNSRPFVIGVLGQDPFGKSLDEIVANERVRAPRIGVARSPTCKRPGPG